MAQIVNNPSFGSQLGQILGQGLGQGINDLAQSRLAHIQQRQQLGQQMSALKQLGLPAELAYLPEKLQGNYLKNYLGLEEMAVPQEPATFAEALSPQPEPKAQQNLQSFLSNMQPSSLAITPKVGQQLAAKGPMPQAPIKEPGVAPKPKAVTPAERRQELIRAKQGRIQAHENKKLQERQQVGIDKETFPYYKELHLENEAAKNGKKRLDRMDQLIEKGKLPNETWYRIWKSLEDSHAYVPVLGNIANWIGSLGRAVQTQSSPDLEEFEKISADFVTDAKKVFGNRLTDADLKAFMARIPTLSLSETGKKQVISNMRSFYDASEAKWKAAKQIIKENGGKRPANFEVLVEERAKPGLDKASKEFVVRPTAPEKELF